MAKSFSFNYFGSEIEATSLGTAFMPSTKMIISSHCIPFTKDGKIIAVNIIGRGIDIPGGHIDDNETAIEAMQREVREEAQITIANPVLADVWRLTSTNTELGLSQKPYLLVYATDVQAINEFIPNNETDKRFTLEPEAFIDSYFGGARMARVMIDRASAIQR